jgi:octaprenyl-diphosphate synthase
MTEAASATVPELHLSRQLTTGDMERVNELIIAYAESDIPLIGQMVRHLVLSGGKRLRPALVLLCSKLMGYSEGNRHIALAAAVEFIHTATLLHDDVVDESELRRGEETANEVWGNSASVLVGDYLLSRAFQLMVSDGSLKVLKILSDASAIIAQGEVLQLTTANALQTTTEQYLEVITGKTATLFAAACELGAVVTDREEWEPRLRGFGLNLGIAFQMMDDALDYSAKQEALGKSIGDDFRDGKITLPVIHAYANGDAKQRAFWERTLEQEEQREEDLATALSYIHQHHGVEHTVATARHYCDLALSQIESLPESDEKAALIEIADFCVNREY